MSSIEITLEGGGIVDTFHNIWDQCEARGLLHIENLEGWVGGVDATVTPDLARFRRHGKFPGRTIRSGRRMDLTLTWHSSIASSAGTAYTDNAYTGAARIASSIAWDEGPYLMTVNEDGFKLSTEVQLDGEPAFQPVIPGSEDAFRIRLPLRASDPFLYSPPQTTSISGYASTPVAMNDWFTQGQMDADGNQVLAWSAPAQSPAVLENAGTADAWPVVQVVADAAAGVELHLDGNTVQYAGPLFEQSPLLIDYKKGSATINGRDASFNLRKREWSPVTPHTSSIISMAFLGPGAGFGQATLSSTWI